MWIYGLTSLLVLPTSFFLFKRAAGTMSVYKLNIVSWIFYFSLFLQSFIGINLVVIFRVYHYMMSKVTQESLLMAYWAVCYVMLMMPLTMVLIQKFFLGGRIKEKTDQFFTGKLVPLQSGKDSTLIFFWCGLSLLALLATLYTYYQIGTLPFIAYFTSSVSPGTFARLRVSAKQGFSGNPYIQNVLSKNLAPLVSYVAYGYYRLYKKDVLHRLWFYLTAIIAVLAITYAGEKAPIIEYFITLFFIKGFIHGSIRRRHLMAILLVTFFLIFLSYSITTGTAEIDIAVNRGPVGRIIMTQIAGLPQHFEVFPDRIPFLRGASFPSWISTSVFGVEHIRSARVVKEIYKPHAVDAGTAGVTNTLFIGEAWANFGWIGFLIAPIVVGVVVQLIHNKLISSRKTPLSLALMAYFIFGFPTTGGFVGFVWNATWLVLTIIVVVGLYSRPILLAPGRNRYRGQAIDGGDS